MADKKPEGTPAPEAAAPPAGGGGFKAWLPLLVTLVAMPALAYGTMTFLIIPKMKQAAAPVHAEEEGGEAEPAEETAEAGHGGEKEKEKEKEEGKESGGHEAAAPSKKGKQTVTLSKMVVNLAGTGGQRYLMASLTLVGTSSKFKGTIEENRDQLLDLASGTLGAKTIADLEKPGARNQIKTELISVFNNALGEALIKEIYIPEMAVQ